MAAMKIQRIWRGRVFRRDQRRAVQSAKVEANLDVDKEAARLLRDFSQGSSLMDFMGVGSGEEAEDQEDPAPQEEEKEGEGEEENMARVAQKSWKLLAKSRAEFQRQYREQAKKPAVAAPVSVSVEGELGAKLDAMAAAMERMEGRLRDVAARRAGDSWGRALARYCRRMRQRSWRRRGSRVRVARECVCAHGSGGDVEGMSDAPATSG